MQFDNRILTFIIIIIVVLSVLSCSGQTDSDTTNVPPESNPPPDKVVHYSYSIINEYPHDEGAFTQGLVYHNGYLYEGTGLIGESDIRKVDIETGEVLQIYEIDEQYFGEGITIVDDKLIQLTYTSHIGFVYDVNTFVQTDSFTYPYEGWGITYDGEYLIVSDGTSTIHFLNPDNYVEVKSITVRDGITEIPFINELEYINGMIYANIWQSDSVAIINPETGKIEGWIDLSGLLTPYSIFNLLEADVLNGIAYDAAGDRLFVTGKHWQTLFEIEITPTGIEE